MRSVSPRNISCIKRKGVTGEFDGVVVGVVRSIFVALACVVGDTEEDESC